MASVKVKFRPSSIDGAEGALYYQVIHKRVVRQIDAGYKIHPAEWDAAAARIVMAADSEENRLHYLTALRNCVAENVSCIIEIIRRLENTGKAYTADMIVKLYSSPADQRFLLSFGRRIVRELNQTGKRRTAETYSTTLNSFERFRSGQGDILLDNVNGSLMATYETWLKEHGICPNSISYYMRNLRAIYNRAVDQELTDQQNPFKHVYTGIDKTVKRAVSLNCIRQIRDLQLTRYMDFARDIFMFSFYTRGMSFIDIAYLKKKDLQNGVLSYRRKKTNQQLFIKWEKPMQAIIDKYNTAGTPYLLPIIKDVSKDERKQYKSAEHRVNCNLKKIGSLLGLTSPLTTYVARHGWASIAKSKNIPISTISEAMGHDSETTTRIYLASLDTSVVDKANSIIIKAL